MGVNLKAVEAEEFLLLVSLVSRASFMGMGVCITHDPLAQRNLLPGLALYSPLQEIRTRLFVSRRWAGEMPWGDSPSIFCDLTAVPESSDSGPWATSAADRTIGLASPQGNSRSPWAEWVIEKGTWGQIGSGDSVGSRRNDCCVPGEGRGPRQPWDLGGQLAHSFTRRAGPCSSRTNT